MWTRSYSFARPDQPGTSSGQLLLCWAEEAMDLGETSKTPPQENILNKILQPNLPGAPRTAFLGVGDSKRVERERGTANLVETMPHMG